MPIRISEIVLAHLGGKRWRVDKEIEYRDGLAKFNIPAGFETDLASVPRFLWAVFPPYGDHLKAAVVHDYLYGFNTISRVQADAIFLAAMKAYGVKAWRRWVMYLAVRVCGGKAYRAGS